MEKFKELLFLNNIKRVGKKTIYNKYWEILKNSTDFDDLVKKMSLEVSEDKIHDALIKSETVYNQVLENTEIQIITVFDNNYPEKLNILENERPLILYVKGNVDALTKPNIAVIGTRKPSPLSKEFESNLVKDIVNLTDRVVVSGLALGCDKIAHQTTVDENMVTIAILPSGVNVIKPASNKNLAKKIIETGGCLVSEYEPNKGPNKGSYVERDVIVAAFCDATFVVECSIDSGTMHTVNAASKYNRTIFTYLPDDVSKDLYDGNRFILENKDTSVKVNNIRQFMNDLNNVKNNKKVFTKQTTLF